MSELTLYTHPYSRGRIVRWMLEEIGAPYSAVIVDYGPAMKGPAYRAINPMGKVPAVRHGDAIITETAAILAYLADAFPEAGLAPAPGTPARGAWYRWLFFGAGPLEQASVAKACGWSVPDQHRGMVGFGSYVETLDALEQALNTSDYLAGDRFSAADLYIGSHINWGFYAGTIEKRPTFERYWARLERRPAHVRAVEIDNALVPLHPVPGMAQG